MSNDTNPTPSLPIDLKELIDQKFSQVAGILAVTRCARDFLDKESPICSALWAASELIEDAKKAVDALYELQDIERGRNSKEVQS